MEKQMESACGAGTHEMMIGTFVGLDGVIRSKAVPGARGAAFASSGMGASPTWVVFCPDNAIAFTDKLSVVGDWRLVADRSMERSLGEGIVWAPTDLRTQDGLPSPYCPREALRRVVRKAGGMGYSALFGFEFEFYLLDNAGVTEQDVASEQWGAYGADSFLERSEFFARLQDMCAESGIPLEQMHCEYDHCQLEISTAPDEPLRAADTAVLTKMVIKRAAHMFGKKVSFSPKPFLGLSGNGGHIHCSITHEGEPIFSMGHGPHALTKRGCSAIAGIESHVVELSALYAGSPVSQLRLSPDSWSGAAVCWGLENREAAIRFCAATPGNPHGANVELKCGDLSANPYYALACILGSSIDGIDQSMELPPEITVNPSTMPQEERERYGVSRLPSTYDEVTEAFAQSSFAKELLGEDVVEADLAIRRLMSRTYGSRSDQDRADVMRYAW